ncbi:hypothetical protein DACRYDRAFT_85095 [Dacryopinax primogenitus]|uniref:Fungal-type protein kinase domain-containing protein n=1 Tax=Dacryopinax primogenitus (strain DJM 731) TaxID=1858805 RepID=M5FQQ9_DACPD|nr:uncharacterized protein DACRYDRAFT_85095 [Dacryopinax primogenitus]EJT97104.1 hypothetical protein DACRYDRAFT_85095 [Dacryopinax primogenitus]
MAGRELPEGTCWIKTDLIVQTGTDDRSGALDCLSAQNSEAVLGRKKLLQKGTTKPVVPISPFLPEIHHRVHYRTVMDNIGEPLHHIERLDVAFNALADVVQACKMMCIAGFNHRDLSPGNIIVDKKEGRGRLSDLEFAKDHMSDLPGHHAGTPDFMAVELIENAYGFRGRPPRTVGAIRQLNQTIPLRHNAGHDLESILWIAIFLLYNSLVLDHDMSIERSGDDTLFVKASQQRQYRDELFDPSRRTRIFMGDTNLYDTMLGHFSSPSVQICGDIGHVETMQFKLKATYRVFETVLSEQERGQTRNAVFLSAHNKFEGCLRTISDLFNGEKCKRVDDILWAKRHSQD